MSLSSQLIRLGHYLAGEFDNREQAMSEPVWYVHLHLWQRPVNLFTEDSLTIFAEQANAINCNNPYRQRIIRLKQTPNNETLIQVQYYMLKNIESIKGAGKKPDLLNTLTTEQIELLPSCRLSVTEEIINSTESKFVAVAPPGDICSFNYLGKSIHISLGFAVSSSKFFSYDKGIDPETGKATWGAVLHLLLR